MKIRSRTRFVVVRGLARAYPTSSNTFIPGVALPLYVWNCGVWVAARSGCED